MSRRQSIHTILVSRRRETVCVACRPARTHATLALGATSSADALETAMNKHRHWIVPLLFVAIAVATMDVRSAQASRSGPRPDNACASSNACLKWANTGSGDAIDGASTSGAGAVGVTSAQGTSHVNARNGVIGTDSGTGNFNHGVTGTSSIGVGVMGTSTNGIGVS